MLRTHAPLHVDCSVVKRVAVGTATHDVSCGDGCIRSRLELENNRPPELLFHFTADHSGHGIDDRRGWKPDDETDRFGRLLPRNGCVAANEGGNGENRAK